MPDRDLSSEILSAYKAGDVETLARIAMELHVRVAGDDQRRARQADKKRRQRAEKEAKSAQLSLGQTGTSRDIPGQKGTEGTPPLPSLSSPTPLINPSFPPVASPADSDPAEALKAYCVGLAGAANNAITARWGEQPTPIRWDAGHSHELALELREKQVPLELARTAIATTIRKSKNREPFRNLAYFRNPILEAFSSARQREYDRRDPGVAQLNSARDVATDELRRRQEQERLQGEYGKERNAALTRWRLHPDNGEEVERIQREADERYGHVAHTLEGRGDRFAWVLAQESAHVDFPPFEEWLAHRQHAQPAAAGT